MLRYFRKLTKEKLLEYRQFLLLSDHLAQFYHKAIYVIQTPSLRLKNVLWTILPQKDGG